MKRYNNSYNGGGAPHSKVHRPEYGGRANNNSRPQAARAIPAAVPQQQAAVDTEESAPTIVPCEAPPVAAVANATVAVEGEETEVTALGDAEALRLNLSNASTALLSSYPFKANYNDHFETGADALRHLAPTLRALQEATKPNNADGFFLYDPYYCAGNVKAKWELLGFPNVHHEMRDFYEDVKNNTMPPSYDILVTNPPYSADHIPRLLDILVAKRKPFAILVPDYVAKKPWYVELLERCFTPSTLFAKPGVLIKNATVPATTKSVDFSTHPLLQRLAAAAPATAAPTGGAYVPPPPRSIKPAPPPPEKAEGDDDDSSGSDSEDGATDAKPATGPGAAPGAEKVKKKRKRYAARHRAKNEPLGVEPFYLVPKKWYDFAHPHGSGHAHSHFRSMWIVWCGARQGEVFLAARAAATALDGTDNALSVCSGLLELEHRGNVEQRNRANPAQRHQQRR